MTDVDVTMLTNDIIPPQWECPYCGKVMETDEQANEILMRNLVVIRQCGDCGYLHCWKLRLTKKFKQRIVELLLDGVEVEGN